MAAIAASLCGCSVPAALTAWAAFLDYRPYLEQGFALSASETIPGATPIGEFAMAIPAGKSEIPLDSAISVAVGKAKTLGATGMSSLRYEEWLGGWKISGVLVAAPNDDKNLQDVF